MSFLEKAWVKKAGWLILLWPVSVVFQILAKARRKKQQSVSAAPADSGKVPLLVIGNISIGGTGKTPLIIALSSLLKEAGFTPGVISRGYGGTAANYPMQVDEFSKVSESGDEAFLIAEKTGCPVVVDPDRCMALKCLHENFKVDVVLSDDGLQHYNLHRDIEIAVVDGQRLFGNGFCLPAGPLREPISRLKEVDHLVMNGPAAEELESLKAASIMELKPRSLVNLHSGEKRPFSGAPFNIGNTIQAISALGNPQRFYDSLAGLPYQLETYSFPDHHAFSPSDFEQRGIDEHQPVVMTEKDAVKCREFTRPNYWYLAVDIKLDDKFTEQLIKQIKQFG